MKCDFFAEYGIKSLEDLNNLESQNEKYTSITDIAQKIKLLTTAFPLKDNIKKIVDEIEKILVNTKQNGILECIKQIKKLLDNEDEMKKNIHNIKQKIKTSETLAKEIKKSLNEKIKLLENTLNMRNLAKEMHKNLVFIRYIQYINDMQNLMQDIGITFDTFTFNNSLPNYSFLLKLRIKLKRPYISKDDEIFHICDSPIKKDKVFKIPMVTSTTWKGNLRFAGIKYLEKESTDKVADRLALLRLFGHENKTERNFSDKIMASDEKTRYEQMVKKYSKSGLLQGRLTFFPTYFNKIRLEVINPHDRKTKAGKNPIFIESVPRDTTGDLFLLYCPFNLAVTTGDPKTEVKKDLEILSEAIKSMFSEYGFGAKKKEYGYAEVTNATKIIYKKNNDIKEEDIANIDEIKQIFDEVKNKHAQK